MGNSSEQNRQRLLSLDLGRQTVDQQAETQWQVVIGAVEKNQSRKGGKGRERQDGLLDLGFKKKKHTPFLRR